MKSPVRGLADGTSSSSSAEIHLLVHRLPQPQQKFRSPASRRQRSRQRHPLRGCSHHRCSGELLRFMALVGGAATAYGHASHPGPRSGAPVAAGRRVARRRRARGREFGRPATLDAFQLDMEPNLWVWLRPTTAGEVPPSVDVTSGALIGDAVVTVGGCGRAAATSTCTRCRRGLCTAATYGAGRTSVAAPSARGGHCVAHLKPLARRSCSAAATAALLPRRLAAPRLDEACSREVRNGVIVATADDEHEVAWEPLLAGGAAHAPSAAQRHSCAVHPRLEWLFVFGGCALDGKCSNALHILRTDSGPAGRAGLLAAAPHWAKIEAVGTPPAPRGAHVALALPLGAEHSDGAIMLLGGANGEHWHADEPLLDLKMRCAAGCAPPSGHCRTGSAVRAGLHGADCAIDTLLAAARATVTAACSVRVRRWLARRRLRDDALRRGSRTAAAFSSAARPSASARTVSRAARAKSTRCPRHCSGRGDCANGVCRCHGGFGGEACGGDERCEARCHDRGECLAAEGSARPLRVRCGLWRRGASPTRAAGRRAHGVCRAALRVRGGHGGGARGGSVCRWLRPRRAVRRAGALRVRGRLGGGAGAAPQPRGLPSTRRRRKPPPAWSKLVEGGRAQCDVAQCSAVGCDARSGACVAPDGACASPASAASTAQPA